MGQQSVSQKATREPVDTRPEATARVLKGASLFLTQNDFLWLPEFRVKSGRRMDLLGLSPKGQFWTLEIKSSVEDFRVDNKWPEYLDYCDLFSFAVSPDFPTEILPNDVGIVITDGYEAFEKRKPLKTAGLSGGARKSLLIRFGRTAASRAARASNELLALGEALSLDTDPQS